MVSTEIQTRAHPEQTLRGRFTHQSFLSTEMYQTEFHHVRTLKIMSEVYYKNIQKDLQLDTLTLDKVKRVLLTLTQH